jgi:ABC-2 type transport system ATP-binding protein
MKAGVPNTATTDCPAYRLVHSENPGHSDEIVIEVRGISKRFPESSRPALDNVSFTVLKGSVYGLLGPNGAGKTTLLSILTGLMTPAAGEVLINGSDSTAGSRERIPGLGAAPQEPAMYPTLTARENLEFFGRMLGLRGARLRERVAWCLGIGELGPYADQRAETFSGGYKRRLNLAISLIHEPSVLILDEPTMAIDPHSRHFIHDRLRELNRSGVTILMSTHYLEEAEQLCDAVAVLDQGRVVAQGSMETLLAAHRPRELALELAAIPRPALLDQLRALPEVSQLAASGCHVCMRVSDPVAAAPSVLRVLETAGVRHLGLSYGAARFESVFLSLTGAG